MKKEIVCPFCRSKQIQASETKLGVMGYYCYHCGCSFIEGEKIRETPPQEISKEEFFDIIFGALKDISGGRVLPDDTKLQIENLFSSVEVYYLEIANLYAEGLYELDCDEKEMEFRKAFLE